MVGSMIVFSTGVLVALALSWLVLRHLRASLVELLSELSRSGTRAAFWGSVYTLFLLLFGLFAGTTTSGYGGEGELATGELFFAFVTQVRTTLLALLGVVVAIAVLTLVQAVRVEEDERREARRATAAESRSPLA